MSVSRRDSLAKKVVTLVLIMMAAATLVGLIFYWPSGKTVTMNDAMKNSLGMNTTLVYGVVVDSGILSCDNDAFGKPSSLKNNFATAPSSSQQHYRDDNDVMRAYDGGGKCPVIVVEITSGQHSGNFVVLNNRPVGGTVSLHEGQKIRLVPDANNRDTRYSFEDMDRRIPLALWLAVTALIIIMVGAWKGFRAIIGVIITLAVVVLWVLPAILSGQSVMVVAVIGCSAALFPAMYFVHGISWKTSSALLGTLISLLVAVTVSRFAVITTHITGMSEEQNVTMQMYMHDLPVVGIVIAGFIIGTIGVLNDVTISQASTVFELAEMDNDATPARIFQAANRVGRDHISSMLYTLVLAYTGSVLPLLLFMQQSSRGLWEILNGETIAIEVLRSLVGAITLALAFPLTNAIATWLAVVKKNPIRVHGVRAKKSDPQIIPVAPHAKRIRVPSAAASIPLDITATVQHPVVHLPAAQLPPDTYTDESSPAENNDDVPMRGRHLQKKADLTLPTTETIEEEPWWAVDQELRAMNKERGRHFRHES